MKKIILVIFVFLFLPVIVSAAPTEMTLTVTPTLIKNNVTPGDFWKSSIKVINNNAIPVRVSVQAHDFKGSKENGQIDFIDQQVSLADKNGVYLSNWIKLEGESFELNPFESREVSFVIAVPETAQPGGHYAALKVGTIPPKDEIGGTNIKISSSIASLVFLRVSGDIVESGIVREFSTTEEFYQDSNVKFIVRFENKGNTHILPQGEIRVKNMFGRESQPIMINQQTEFGNILPNDIRRWDFEWSAGDDWWDMGRYRANLLLSYGEQAKETTGQYFYFWIIKPKPLLIAVGSILFFILLFVWSVKRFVRRAVLMAQGDLSAVATKSDVKQAPVRQIIEPVRPSSNKTRGVIDLKERMKK